MSGADRPNPRWKKRVRHAGSRVLSAVEGWTAPGGRPEWSESGMSALIATVTVVTGLMILLVMMITWLANS